MSKQTLFFPTCVKVGPIKAARDGDGGGWIWGPGRTQASGNGMDRIFTEDNQTEPSAERIDDYLFACSKVRASQGQLRTVTERSLPIRSQKMC